jgi:hypothetical protein
MEPEDLIQVVIDEATAERLRVAADARGIHVELLMVQLLVAASTRIDDLLEDGEVGEGEADD